MKPLSVAVPAILVTLLGLVQSVVLPTSKSTNSHPSKAASLVHQGHIHTRTGTKTRGDSWQPNETHLHTRSKSHGVPWQPEHTSASHSEHTIAGHPRGEGQFNSRSFYVEPFTHTRTDSHSQMATGIRHTRFIISTYHPNITSHPPACTVDGIRCRAEGADEHHPTHTNGWTNSEHPRHTDRTEFTHTTHHLPGTRYFSHLTITDGVHPTAHPDIIHPRDVCDGACSSGYICDTGDSFYVGGCAKESATTTVTVMQTSISHNFNPQADDGDDTDLCSDGCPVRERCSFVAGSDFPKCTPVEPGTVSSSSDNGNIELLPCPKGMERCPAGQVCALVESFDFDFLVCLPDKNTTTINARSEATSGSGPVHCTEDTIFLEPFGNHNINITYLGCAGLLKPHYYTNGTCLCENPSNPFGVSPGMTGASPQQVPHETLTPISHQTPSSHLGPYPPFHVNITGHCRVEQNIDSPDSWNGGDKIQNHTRHICMTGSVPLLSNNGSCDCISRSTTHTTGHDGTGKMAKTFDTPFSTIHATGRGLVEVTTEMTTYQIEHSGLPSISTTADTAADSTATPHSLPKPGTLFNHTFTIASTSAKVGSFPFNPKATVMATMADITPRSLAWEPTPFLTSINTGLTFISEIGKREAVTPASPNCPEDFQIVNAQHPHPCKWTTIPQDHLPYRILTCLSTAARKDCPVIVQVPTRQRWGNMSIAYSSLDEFCHLLHTPSRAYLPYGMDLQPIIDRFCHDNSIDKRNLALLPTTTGNAFPTLNSAHPRPPGKLRHLPSQVLCHLRPRSPILLTTVSDAEPINIELYVGDDIDNGVGTGPRYITRFYPKGLAAFCSFLKDESEEYIKSLLPPGADRKQMIAEYCKDVPKYKREPAPTKTTHTYETINSASPTPSKFLSCLHF
jgi:hypothetical protein